MKPIKKGGDVLDLSKALELGRDTGRIPNPMLGYAVIRAVDRGKTPGGVVTNLGADNGNLLDDQGYYYIVEACSPRYFVQSGFEDSPIKVGMQVLINRYIAQPLDYVMDLPRGHFLIQLNWITSWLPAPAAMAEKPAEAGELMAQDMSDGERVRRESAVAAAVREHRETLERLERIEQQAKAKAAREAELRAQPEQLANLATLNAPSHVHKHSRILVTLARVIGRHLSLSEREQVVAAMDVILRADADATAEMQHLSHQRLEAQSFDAARLSGLGAQQGPMTPADAAGRWQGGDAAASMHVQNETLGGSNRTR